MSCITICWPSRPVTSEMATTLREPSERRDSWMTMSTAEAICSRMAREGSSMPLMSTIVSRREITSRGEFACTVVSEPSWPVFIACSMSSASPPRHSPTMMRSGRMRRQFFTRSRIGTAPRPSMFGGRASSRTTWGCRRRSSAASSTVTMRSFSGMKPERRLSRVVFPDPVPPATITFLRIITQAFMNSAALRVQVPNRMKSSTESVFFANFRMVIVGPESDSGGMIALTRDPSARRASTYGCDSSMRRPIGETMRSITAITLASSMNCMSVSSSLPCRST